MAKRGRKVSFHGAFGSRAAANRKHKRVKNSYVKRTRIRGQGTRWLVLTRKKRR